MKEGKIIIARFNGLMSEYKTLDEFTKKEAKKVEGYKPFMDKCRSEKTPYMEIKDDLSNYMESVNNLRILKDDLFNKASAIAECVKMIDILSVDLPLSDEDVELVEACKDFTKPVFYIENGKVKIQDTQYNDYVNQLKAEINKDANSIEMEYNQMLAQ